MFERTVDSSTPQCWWHMFPTTKCEARPHMLPILGPLHPLHKTMVFVARELVHFRSKVLHYIM